MNTDAPSQLLSELAPHEAVLRVTDVEVAPTPEGSKGLHGVAVLTSDRLAIVPGVPKPARNESGSPLAQVVAELWRMAKPALLEAFPLARLFSTPRATQKAHLAARARPGIEIPLQMIGRAFETRVPGCIGIELALPMPDPRPPFALYLRLSGLPAMAREWAQIIETERAHAHPLPELERPYALHYLLRDPPRPEVRVHAPGPPPFAVRGILTLGADGPVLGRRVDAMLPYESISGLAWSEPSALRRGRLALHAGPRTWVMEPVREYDVRLLLDAARLVSELTLVPIKFERGPVRTGKIVAWATAGGAAGSTVAWEVLHALLHWI